MEESNSSFKLTIDSQDADTESPRNFANFVKEIRDDDHAGVHKQIQM
jgi:hypothetical protein